MAVLWGLASALSFGTGDFLGREASRREGTLKSLLYLYLIGSILMAALTLSTETIPWQDLFSTTGVLMVLVGLTVTIGNYFLYHGLVRGPLLVTAPIGSSFAAVTVVFSLLSGERPTAINFAGIVVTLVGVVFASLATSEAAEDAQPGTVRQPFSWVSPGIAFALGASFLLGVGFWAFRFVTPVLGSQTTVLVQRVTALVFSVIYLRARNVSTRLDSLSSLKWMLPMGAFDAAGYWFYNIGLLSGLTSIVSVITGLFAIITMLWGFVISRERISRIQWMGVAVTLAGVALVSV